MTGLIFLKMQQKRYERKRKRIQKFLNDFRTDKANALEALSGYTISELSEELQSFIYDNKEVLSDDKIALLISINDIINGED